MKERKHQRLHTGSFHLYDVLEKEKWRGNIDQWLPEVRAANKGGTGQFLEISLYLDCSGGLYNCMSVQVQRAVHLKKGEFY